MQHFYILRLTLNNWLSSIARRVRSNVNPARPSTGFCIGFALACGLALASGTLVRAEAPAPVKPVSAGCNFTVNSNADDHISDSNLTLREALLLVKGGTGATPPTSMCEFTS